MRDRYDSKPHHYYSNSRAYSKSPSRSRSRDKYRQKHHRDQKSKSPIRKQERRYLRPIKIESDIKNHFKFEISHLGRNQLERVIQSLKEQMMLTMGPIQHITVAKNIKDDNKIILNVGFKYDLDAASYHENNLLTLKINERQITINSRPTQIFQLFLDDMQRQSAYPKYPEPEKYESDKYEKYQKKESKKRSKQRERKYSSSSESQGPRQYRSSHRSRHQEKQRQKLTKVLIFGVPHRYTQKNLLAMINDYMGGLYICHNYYWRRIKESCCQYFQFEIQPSKANKVIETGPKMQIDGRPIIAIEDTSSLSQALMEYQISIQFPKKVQPFYVLKGISSFAKVVQMTANQQIQQDGKCKSYAITLNDRKTAHQLRKMGTLGNGIILDHIKHKEYVYRPTQSTLLPLQE